MIQIPLIGTNVVEVEPHCTSVSSAVPVITWQPHAKAAHRHHASTTTLRPQAPLCLALIHALLTSFGPNILGNVSGRMRPSCRLASVMAR